MGIVSGKITIRDYKPHHFFRAAVFQGTGCVNLTSPIFKSSIYRWATLCYNVCTIHISICVGVCVSHIISSDTVAYCNLSVHWSCLFFFSLLVSFDRYYFIFHMGKQSRKWGQNINSGRAKFYHNTQLCTKQKTTKTKQELLRHKQNQKQTNDMWSK